MEFYKLKVTLTFESVDEILWSDHSNISSLPVLTNGAICLGNLEIWSKFAFVLIWPSWLSASNVSLWYQCFLKQLGDRNLGNDHTRWIYLILQQLLHTTSIGNVLRQQIRFWLLRLGFKSLIRRVSIGLFPFPICVSLLGLFALSSRRTKMVLLTV